MDSKDLIELWDTTGGQLHDLLDQELLSSTPPNTPSLLVTRVDADNLEALVLNSHEPAANPAPVLSPSSVFAKPYSSLAGLTGRIF